MKKSVLFSVIGLLLALAMAIPASASDYVEVGGYFEWSSPKNDEVLCGEAGEATTTWDVPLLAQTPMLDGIIMPGEYARFENYEDYMSFTATINVGESTFEELCEMARGGIFDAYWGWDGQYLYLAFDVDCINGYSCSPEQDVMLFAYNCLQVGMAPVDSEGRNSDQYLEMGFGYDNNADKEITFSWSPMPDPYSSGENDFAASFDETTQQVVYELRIDLESALKWDQNPEVGDQINFAFVLEISGENDVNKSAQLLFCHGISGQYSMKCTQYFARITLSDQIYGEEETTEPETELETEPETTLAETEPEVTVPEEIVTEAVDTTEWYTEVDPFYTMESMVVVPLPDVDIPEEMTGQDIQAALSNGGLIQKLFSYIDLQNCTSVSFAGVVPLMLVLGAVFIKKKDDK